MNGVEITDSTVCAKCGKPLGTAAMVRVNDSEFYHYTCCDIDGYERWLDMMT